MLPRPERATLLDGAPSEQFVVEIATAAALVIWAGGFLWIAASVREGDERGERPPGPLSFALAALWPLAALLAALAYLVARRR